ncbi:MAG: beta-Ala-His dipeptidase [Sedimentibacter sp.]|uniref:beta-Ala-His dipeptidase n=1 Tax=Sedimentibacter sp. TaxID=1960295 RepID=UPI00315864FC
MNSIDNVFIYFREISKIPRETTKEKQISDYLVDFAQKRNLEVHRDQLLNVIIKKKSNIENYSGPTVILQGHMDMVYEKSPDSSHVYENGIEIVERDGYVYASDKTTLGGDNGIALAYCLAILDSDEIKHPHLEVIITTQEEGGLAGANALNTDSLKGKYLINLDSEEEGVFFTSCAGGVRNNVLIPVEKEEIECRTLLSVNISGLKGGHSGIEIDRERGNAIKLMGRLLYSIDSPEISMVSLQCPGKANAISSSASVLLAVPDEMTGTVTNKIKEVEASFKKELQFTDTIKIECFSAAPVSSGTINAYTGDVKKKIINTLMLIPYGVMNKSYAIPGLVQTSVNVGSLEESEHYISILSSIRSSVESQKYNVADTIRVVAELYGAKCEFFNDYPQWEYKQDSHLRDLAVRMYEEIFEKKARLTAIHAGLECGYFDSKLKNADIISMGPDLFEVHTPNEHASVQSIKNVWVLLLKILEKLAEE